MACFVALIAHCSTEEFSAPIVNQEAAKFLYDGDGLFDANFGNLKSRLVDGDFHLDDMQAVEQRFGGRFRGGYRGPNMGYFGGYRGGYGGAYGQGYYGGGYRGTYGGGFGGYRGGFNGGYHG